MANTFNWQLGHEGKGNVYNDGSISTWNVNHENAPHHREKGYEDEKVPRFHFYLSPEGGLWDGGTTFNNQTPRSDDQVVSEVVAQHPAVYDARHELSMDWDEHPEERVEMPGGGFGHAEELMRMTASDESGWASFHTELKLPRGTRKKIRRWVDRLKWPEGHEKEDARRYHITILSMDEYDEDFAKWARKQIQGRVFSFKSTGMDIFGGEHVVCRLDCPEWTELVKEWQEVADKKGLEPRKFDPPKAHVTLGKSPEGKWPQGIPNPHIKFDTRMFNINKNSMAVDPEFLNSWTERDPYLYHGRQEHPDTVRQYGIEGSYGSYYPTPSVYLTNQDVLAEHFAQHPGLEQEWAEPGHESEEYPVHPGNWVYKIDPRKLDPSKLDSDEWNTSYPEGMEYHGDEFSASPELEDHVSNPEVVHNQWETGKPLAYRGTIPPEAIVDHYEIPMDKPRPWINGMRGASIETTPADDLKAWLDSFNVEQEQQPLSLHHTDGDDFMPKIVAPVVQAPHVDPPSKPYQPYNWAEEGWDESPLDRTSSIKAFEDDQYPTGRTLETEPKEPEDEADGVNGDKLVFYDGSLGAAWYVVDGGDGDFISGPWSDEDEARSINEGEWKESSPKTSAIDTHICPKCGEDSNSPICATCGYDPQNSPDDYQQMKSDWYDRAWSVPGNQPQPIPQPIHHWRDDHAKNVSLARKDPNGYHHSYRWSVSDESSAWGPTDDLSTLRNRESSSLQNDPQEGRSGLQTLSYSVSGSSSLGGWHGF